MAQVLDCTQDAARPDNLVLEADQRSAGAYRAGVVLPLNDSF